MVYGQAAATLKKVVLELGGKSANIICDDVDLDKVVETVVIGFTLLAGQACALLTRTLVHESLHDELVARVTAALDYVMVGDPADPSDPSTVMGPPIREAHRDKVESMIQAGLDEGTQIAYGGGRPADLECCGGLRRPRGWGPRSARRGAPSCPAGMMTASRRCDPK
jgi:aldehyde dehydrogenase (NAD+)